MALVTLKTLSPLFCITSFNLDVSDSLLVTRNDLNSLAILSNLHFLSFSLSLFFFFSNLHFHGKISLLLMSCENRRIFNVFCLAQTKILFGYSISCTQVCIPEFHNFVL